MTSPNYSAEKNEDYYQSILKKERNEYELIEQSKNIELLIKIANTPEDIIPKVMRFLWITKKIYQLK